MSENAPDAYSDKKHFTIPGMNRNIVKSVVII